MVGGRPQDIFFNPVDYGPRNTTSISTASLINSLSSPKNIDYNLYGPLQVPASRPSVDVNAQYLKSYANDASVRNRADDRYALSLADYASRNGSAAGAFGGEFLLGLDRKVNSGYAAATGLLVEPTFVAAEVLIGGRKNYSTTYQTFNANPTASVSQNLITGTRTVRDAVFQTQTLSSGYQYFTNPTIENAREFSDNLFNTSLVVLGGTQLRVRAGAATVLDDAQSVSTRTFAPSTEFYSNATGNTYKAFQRTDINWQQIRTSGDRRAIGLTNADAAEQLGLPPQLSDGNFATLHHSQQNARGPLFEASTRYHNISTINSSPLHPYGTTGHPHNPMGRGSGSARQVFQSVESPEYWMWRAISR